MLDIFTKIFDKTHSLVFEAVNTMIKDDRDCKIVDRGKIRRVLEVFEIVDTVNPELIKNEDEYIWKGERVFAKLKEWFSSFAEETKKYVSAKAKREILSLSAPEYTRSCLKYLEEERQRCQEYIFPDFHANINSYNYEFLIKNNARDLCKVF